MTAADTAKASALLDRAVCARTSPTSQPCSSTWGSCWRGLSGTPSARRLRFAWPASSPGFSEASSCTSPRCFRCLPTIPIWRQCSRMCKDRSKPSLSGSPSETTPVLPNNSWRPWRSDPGTWATVPPDIQQVMIENAPTFLDEANDPEQLDFDLESISRFSKPVLLTLGDQSPPTFAPVVARLSGALPHADIVTLQGAGHVPHETHPDAYVEAVIEFTRKHTA